ncbi:MAG: hypothetical protein V9E91_00750 [Burkholderiaceae bacterium]
MRMRREEDVVIEASHTPRNRLSQRAGAIDSAAQNSTIPNRSNSGKFEVFAANNYFPGYRRFNNCPLTAYVRRMHCP